MTTVAIEAPVGRGGKNQKPDVSAVQILLNGFILFNKLVISGNRPPLPLLAVHGTCDEPTVTAIFWFQRCIMEMSNPDGRVDPKGKTLETLNGPLKYATEVKGALGRSLKTTAPLCFPIPFIPNSDYRTGGRKFGASRSGGKRKHAGCDLIAPEGTRIHAINDGEVIRGPYHFYRGTYAIEVKHPDFVARYCEIKSTTSEVKVGATVTEGQHIAFVGKMYYSSMLHFELYSGEATGPLTVGGNPPFKRRSDLLDPTPYLEIWAHNLPV